MLNDDGPQQVTIYSNVRYYLYPKFTFQCSKVFNILFLDSGNAYFNYFLLEMRALLYAVIIDNFLPFIILLVCNVIIICKMQNVMKRRTEKLNVETHKNVYGVLPMMLGELREIFTKT